MPQAGQGVLVTELDAEPVVHRNPVSEEQKVGSTDLLPVVQTVRVEKSGQTDAVTDGLLGQFLRDPGPFSFDAAVLLMLRTQGQNAAHWPSIRFQTQLGTAYPGADVTSVQLDQRGFRATVTLMGLTGPTGVLPLHYSAELVSEYRRHSPALGDFLEMLSQRPIAQFAESGLKYRLASNHALPEGTPLAGYARTARKVLMSLAGFYRPEIAPSLGVNSETISFYSGYFATMPRSADRLQALLSDWLGLCAVVEEFTPLWVQIPADQQSYLRRSGLAGQYAESFSQLGVDASIGARYLDCQSQFTVRIGPVGFAIFQALMPSGTLYGSLLKLIRTFVGSDLQIILRPVLKKDAVPALQLPTGRQAASSRLGWSCWLCSAKERSRDADEPVFTEQYIEMSSGD